MTRCQSASLCAARAACLPSLPPGRVVFVAITMFQRPEKAAAYAELRRHLLLLGAWVGAVRASTYVLHYLNEK